MKLQHFAFCRAEGSATPHIYDLASGLTALDARTHALSADLSDLVGHVLYGARLDRNVPNAHAGPGYVDVVSGGRRFRLERHLAPATQGSSAVPKLTVAALDGQAAGAHTARQLLGGIAPEIAARLFVLRSSGSDQLDWLVSEELATELHELEQSADSHVSGSWTTAGYDDLFVRRDVLAHQIETLLADKRRTSEALQATLAELEVERHGAENEVAEQREQLEGVLASLAELETQLRYHELADFVGRASDEAHRDSQQPRLTEIDQEIAKWRGALADLEAREAQLRHRLAQLHPDDGSPLLPLADQRACVAIAQRLIADLDSEVARHARTVDSQSCLCRQTHARLHPLVDTLGQQVDKLGRLIEQYEAAVEIEQLRTEIQHLGRSQTELRGTIDHLLDRRQSRLRTSRVRLTEADPRDLPTNWRELQASWEERRGELKARIADGERQLAALETRRAALERERATLHNDSPLAELRRQLDAVNQQIELGRGVELRSARSVAPWRASDVLAKLSDGRLRELRLVDGGRKVKVTHRDGHTIGQHELNDVDRRLVALSLQLAAVAGTTGWGLELPLVVADPFAELPAMQASILSLVLHDWAAEGHQVLLITASESVLDRLRGIGQSVLDLDAAPSAARPLAISQPVTTHVEPIETFALSLDDGIERFSVFGEDTSNVFGKVGIHRIADLLAADADDVSHALDRTGVSSSMVSMWQTHVAMLVYVPNLTLDDVQLITGAEIRDLQHLAAADADALYEAVQEFLASPRGVRHRSLRTGVSRKRVARWISAAEQSRGKWQHSRYAQRSVDAPTEVTPRRRPSHRNGSVNGNGSANGHASRKGRPAKKKQQRPLRFRLGLASAVVDAPSVGPKMAKRLRKLGITTVADLLEADAAATAESLDVSYVTAEKVVAWQHQAQLMCRVPELLARDTQILVACGFNTPEDIAGADAADLYEFAKSFTSTPEGTRVLRGSDAPDLARVKKWVYLAEHRRALEAA